jgi:hypothetical protein
VYLLPSQIAAICQLSKETYSQWAYKVKFQLQDASNVLTDAIPTGIVIQPNGRIKEDPTIPQAVPAATLDLWKVQNKLAMNILLATIKGPEFEWIKEKYTAKEIWAKITKQYGGSSMLYQLDVLECLFQLNFRNANAQKDIEKHLNDFQKLYNEIKTFQGIQIPEAYYIYRFLQSLPETFNSFSRSYDNIVERFSLPDIMSSLCTDKLYHLAHSSYKTGDSRSPPVALNTSASQSHQAKGKKGKGNNKQKDK